MALQHVCGGSGAEEQIGDGPQPQAGDRLADAALECQHHDAEHDAQRSDHREQRAAVDRHEAFSAGDFVRLCILWSSSKNSRPRTSPAPSYLWGYRWAATPQWRSVPNRRQGSDSQASRASALRNTGASASTSGAMRAAGVAANDSTRPRQPTRIA